MDEEVIVKCMRCGRLYKRFSNVIKDQRYCPLCIKSEHDQWARDGSL